MCYVDDAYFVHPVFGFILLQGTWKQQKNWQRSVHLSYVGRMEELKKTTIPISHSCPVGCWDCSGDCRFSINLEMQLDTGASDREEETLSRSITSLACHSYKRPD